MRPRPKKIYVPRLFKTTIEVWTFYDPTDKDPEELLAGPRNMACVTYTEEDKYVCLHELLAGQHYDITFVEEIPTRDEVETTRRKYPPPEGSDQYVKHNRIPRKPR